MAEHAPGPWKRSDTIFPAVEDATGKRVGMFHVNTRSTAEMEANCRLVAAAPELLAACRAFLYLQEAPPGTLLPYDHLAGQIRSAVAMATGGSP